MNEPSPPRWHDIWNDFEEAAERLEEIAEKLMHEPRAFADLHSAAECIRDLGERSERNVASPPPRGRRFAALLVGDSTGLIDKPGTDYTIHPKHYERIEVVEILKETEA